MKCLIAAVLSLTSSLEGASTRLKDLTTLEGVRDNQLLGYGLVVGLAGTGDKSQSVFSAQSLANMLRRMGVSVQPAAIQAKNTAAVMVTANLPAFAQPGTRIDVTVAAMGDAQNLQGGLLLICPLKAADGETFAVAQGPLITGGFVASGGGGNAQTTNHPTTARVPGGAIVERRPPSQAPGNTINLQLRYADFTTAARVAQAINRKFATPDAPIARAENSALISVQTPAAFAQRPVEFLAEMETLTVDSDRAAKVVVNERTGSIVLGREVRLSPATILHGSLTVEVETTQSVSQPPALSSGTTARTAQTTVGVKEDKARNVNLKPDATVEDLVRALKSIGSTPREMIAILEALKAAGALEAVLEVI